MKRTTVIGFTAGVLTGALVSIGFVASATPTDPCAQFVNTSSNSVSGYENYRYLDCRLDRTDAALRRIEAKLGTAPSPSPSATPSATPAPSVTPSVTPTPTVTPSVTPSPSATPSVTPTPTVTPSETPTPTATPSATPTVVPGALKGWQVNADTVGLKPHGLTCATLPAYTGPDKPARGATISGKLVRSSLDLSAGGVTIEKSCIRPTGVGRGMPVLTTTDNNVTFQPGADLVTIRDSEITGELLSNEIGALSTGFIGIATMQRNYVHHLGSGLALMTTGRQLDALVENNYVTNLLGWGNPATTGNHSDAFTIRDFTDADRADRKAVVRNNRFDCDSPNATGAFFIQAYSGRIDNVTVDGNLLEGGGWLLALEWKNSGYSNVSATDNRFNVQGFGPVYEDGGPGWASWSENYRYDATKADGKGARIG